MNLVLFCLGDEESNKLKAAAFSNQALCHQKLNEHFEAKQAVSRFYFKFWKQKKFFCTWSILNNIFIEKELLKSYFN